MKTTFKEASFLNYPHHISPIISQSRGHQVRARQPWKARLTLPLLLLLDFPLHV